MKKVLFGISALIIVFGLLFYFAEPNRKNTLFAGITTAITGQITASEYSYNFGTISMKNGNVTHTYTLKNTSEKHATITRFSTSCMCTKAVLVIDDKRIGPFGMPGHGGSVPTINETLEAGQEGQIEVTFDPAAHGASGIGKVDRTVFIESSSNPTVKLKFTAMVMP